MPKERQRCDDTLDMPALCFLSVQSWVSAVQRRSRPFYYVSIPQEEPQEEEEEDEEPEPKPKKRLRRAEPTDEAEEPGEDTSRALYIHAGGCRAHTVQ